MNLLLLSIIVVIYLLIISYLGWLGYKHTKTTEDYMLAGRGAHPYIMAISYGATFISTSAIVGFGGVAGLFGLSLLWLTFLNIFVGIFIAFVFFGKRTRRMSHHLNAHTFPEFLGLRYQSRFIQVFSGLVILTMVIYAAGVLIGAGRHLEEIMGMSFDVALLVVTVIITAYVIFGGMKGVMYTDAFQGTVMFVGMLMLFIMTVSNLGGLSKTHKELEVNYKQVLSKEHLSKKIVKIASENKVTLTETQAYDLGKAYMGLLGQIKAFNAKNQDKAAQKKFVGESAAKIQIADAKLEVAQTLAIFGKAKNYVLQHFVMGSLHRGGHRGWTAMPASGSPIWWLIVSTIVLGVGIGVLAQPQLSVRFMTVRSDRELNRSVLVGGVFIIVMTGVAFVIGASSNAFFFDKHDGLSAFGLAMGNVDKIIPMFLNESMPTWFNYIFLLTLLSAAMSTLSSQFHSMGTAISRDILEATGLIQRDNANAKKSMLMAKLGVAAMILITVILGFSLPDGIIAAATAIFFGICATSFLPMLVGALYWKGATKSGAIASLISGFGISLFWLIFVHDATVKKIGTTSILGNSMWAHVDPLLIALPISTIIFILVSLMSKKYEASHIEVCYKGMN